MIHQFLNKEECIRFNKIINGIGVAINTQEWQQRLPWLRWRNMANLFEMWGNEKKIRWVTIFNFRKEQFYYNNLSAWEFK